LILIILFISDKIVSNKKEIAIALASALTLMWNIIIETNTNKRKIFITLLVTSDLNMVVNQLSKY